MGILLVTLLLAVACVTGTSYNGYKVYSVSPTSIEQINALKSVEIPLNLDFWENLSRGDLDRTYRIMVEPKHISSFENELNQYQIISSILFDNVTEMVREETARNLQSRKLGRNVDGVDLTHFWKYDEIVVYLEKIATKYPNLVTLERLGTTHENNEIIAVKISKSSGGVDDTRPVIIVEGTIHAREWIGTMVCVHLISELVENSEKHSQLLDGLDWIIVPVMNVDGYKYSHITEPEQGDRFWRKNRSPITVPGQEHCVGVDLNRNFGYKWELKVGTSDNPCDLLWPGVEAESEKETKIMKALLLKYKKTALFLDVHSHGNYLLYPWAYDYILADTFLMYDEIGSRARQAIYNVNKTKYRMGNTAFTLYSCSGVTTDFASGVAKIPLSWTIELPGGGTRGFDIEPERIQSVVDETLPAIRELALFAKEQY